MAHRVDAVMKVNSVEGSATMSLTFELEDVALVLADLSTQEFRTQVLDALAVHKVGRELGITASHRDFTISEEHRHRGNN